MDREGRGRGALSEPAGSLRATRRRSSTPLAEPRGESKQASGVDGICRAWPQAEMDPHHTHLFAFIGAGVCTNGEREREGKRERERKKEREREREKERERERERKRERERE